MLACVALFLAVGSLTDAPLRQLVFEAPTALLPPGTERPALLTILTRDGGGKLVAGAHLAVFTFVQNVAHRAAEVDSDAHGAATVHLPEGDTWVTATAAAKRPGARVDAPGAHASPRRAR